MANISDKDKFIQGLTSLGGSAGNKALREQLGWPEEKYWKIRENLIEEDIVTIGSGKGGSVKLTSKSAFAAEKDLYAPLRETISKNWRTDWPVDELLIEVTASQGKKQLGKWSQPDLCVVTKKTYKYLSQKHIDIWTFEVKPRGEMSVTHVLEAVAHSRFAHRSYILFHIEDIACLGSGDFAHCLDEVDRHSIGLATFQDPKDYKSIVWHREANRREPNPEYLEEFIDQQLPEHMKSHILKWLK